MNPTPTETTFLFGILLGIIVLLISAGLFTFDLIKNPRLTPIHKILWGIVFALSAMLVVFAKHLLTPASFTPSVGILLFVSGILATYAFGVTQRPLLRALSVINVFCFFTVLLTGH
jgi:hypothetical protein